MNQLVPYVPHAFFTTTCNRVGKGKPSVFEQILRTWFTDINEPSSLYNLITCFIVSFRVDIVKQKEGSER